MRNAFLETIRDLARKDERIWLLAGDLGFSVLEPFIREFPNRFINMGVAEQNMTGVAAGLAREGNIVFTYSIANFPIMRCLEQIRNDVCYHNLNVTIVAVGGGLAYGAAGYTHHAVEDLAVMRAMPNMAVLAPGDPVEVRLAVHAIILRQGPCYLRLGKGGEPVVHRSNPAFAIGKAILVREGSDVTIISAGGILYEVVKAAERLAPRIQARVFSMPTVKPLDENTLRKAAMDTGGIVVVEEHSGVGGLGSAVSELLAASVERRVPFWRIHLDEGMMHDVGNQTSLRRKSGMTADGMAWTIQEYLKNCTSS